MSGDFRMSLDENPYMCQIVLATDCDSQSRAGHILLRKIKTSRFEKKKKESRISGLREKKADSNLYRGPALSLCGALSDQSTTERNLYSNALSISIIGEELSGTHNGETIALSATFSGPQRALRHTCVRMCAS